LRLRDATCARFAHPVTGNLKSGGVPAAATRNRREEDSCVSIIDKITGRTKKAAGDLADDPSLRAEGRREERKGEAKEKLDQAQDRVAEKAQEVSDLERKT
jgi:uncharacterized protein YjbJ (UPF0337 family)